MRPSARTTPCCDPYLLQLEVIPGIPLLRTFNLTTSWQPTYVPERKPKDSPKHHLADSKFVLPLQNHFFVTSYCSSLGEINIKSLRNAEGVLHGETPIVVQCQSYHPNRCYTPKPPPSRKSSWKSTQTNSCFWPLNAL